MSNLRSSSDQASLQSLTRTEGTQTHVRVFRLNSSNVSHFI